MNSQATAWHPGSALTLVVNDAERIANIAASNQNNLSLCARALSAFVQNGATQGQTPNTVALASTMALSPDMYFPPTTGGGMGMVISHGPTVSSTANYIAMGPNSPTPINVLRAKLDTSGTLTAF